MHFTRIAVIFAIAGLAASQCVNDAVVATSTTTDKIFKIRRSCAALTTIQEPYDRCAALSANLATFSNAAELAAGYDAMTHMFNGNTQIINEFVRFALDYGFDAGLGEYVAQFHEPGNILVSAGNKLHPTQPALGYTSPFHPTLALFEEDLGNILDIFNSDPDAIAFSGFYDGVSNMQSTWWQTNFPSSQDAYYYICEETKPVCNCSNVNSAPTCTGTASGVVFTVTCTIPNQDDKNILFAAQGLTDTHANVSWSSTNNVFSRPRVPNPAGFVSETCTNPTTPRFYAPSSQGWVYSYDDTSCQVVATLTFGPNNLPSSFLFDNESQATSVSAIPNYNVITVPVAIAITTQISNTQITVSNTLFTFYARLPTALATNATAFALKLFKLSDNNRDTNTAFSAIVMGGLTTGPNRHVLTGTPVFIPDPSSPSLNCTIQAEIYVSCGPFVDTNSPSPVTVSGVLEVYAQCSTVGCIARKLTLPVSFLAGDYQSTLDGTWSTLTPLIWRRLENNDTLDVELTNDVIVGGDKLILSLHFDAGSVSTLTKLFMTVTGFSGAGATLVEYSNGNANNVFVIEDTNILSPVHFASTIIYNQLQQSLIDSFFRFPNSYDINFAVQWDWPATLPTDFRGQVDVSSFFDIAYAVRRRQGDSNQYALIQAPQNSVGDVNADGVTTLVIDSASGLSVVSFIVAVLAILLL